MEPDHTLKIAMPMTAASVAQRRMGFKAPRAQKYEGQSPYLVSQGFSRWGVMNRIEERGHPPLDSAGGVYGHSVTERWKRASKYGTIRRPHKRSKRIRGELRALIRHPWLQSPG